MQTHMSVRTPSQARATLALMGGTLLMLLSGGAQAQFTRSRPHPSAPADAGGTTETHPSSGHSDSSKSTTHKSDGASNDRGTSNGVARGGKVDFKILFPAGKRGEPPYKVGLPLPNMPGDDIFAEVRLPGRPADASPSSEHGTTVPNVRRAARTGSTKTDATSLDRYKNTQEAGPPAGTANNVPGGSQSIIVWPYDYLSPFYGYGPDAVFGWPRSVYCGVPDPTVYCPGHVPIIVLGWPNYDMTGAVTCDVTYLGYRIGKR